MGRHYPHLPMVSKVIVRNKSVLVVLLYDAHTNIIFFDMFIGSSSSFNLSGLIGYFPARTILMIVVSFTVVLTVVAVSIGVICRIQFRSAPSSSPPCIIQRINDGSRTSAHSRKGSSEGENGRDKRVVLLSINGGNFRL